MHVHAIFFAIIKDNLISMQANRAFFPSFWGSKFDPSNYPFSYCFRAQIGRAPVEFHRFCHYYPYFFSLPFTTRKDKIKINMIQMRR